MVQTAGPVVRVLMSFGCLLYTAQPMHVQVPARAALNTGIRVAGAVGAGSVAAGGGAGGAPPAAGGAAAVLPVHWGAAVRRHGPLIYRLCALSPQAHCVATCAVRLNNLAFSLWNA